MVKKPILIDDKNRKRHQLLTTTHSLPEGGVIHTLPDLIKHLQWAIEVEHSTIPPYLCALYSIQEGTNSFAYNTIRSVVLEEMLHMVQACNILTAIGGTPVLNDPLFIPAYPAPLPKSNPRFNVGIEKFKPHSIETFLKIEKPSVPNAKPQGENYDTIGQFYEAVKLGLQFVDDKEGGIFKSENNYKQITPEQYYGSGGQIYPVYSLKNALDAINEIVGQGEGLNHTIEDPDHVLFGEDIDYAHYFKFNEIYMERRYLKGQSPETDPQGSKVDIDWNSVHDMQDNPKMAYYAEDTPIYKKMLAFNVTYMKILDGIEKACNGKPEMLMIAIHLMYDLKYKAIELMTTPNSKGQMVGPSFEYVNI
jgi:hypothetical protein